MTLETENLGATSDALGSTANLADTLKDIVKKEEPELEDEEEFTRDDDDPPSMTQE